MFPEKTLAKIVATTGGAGYIPFAPGTFGALAGLLFSLLLRYVFTLEESSLHLIHLFLSLIFYFSGVWACKKLKPEWGDDPSRVVMDETVGFWISIILIPARWEYYVAAFVLFRFFDIAKPLGIRKIDQMHSSHAVMLDDVVAGLYANLVLQLIILFYA
jgi:phosphatidylglycerophosphatase A